VWTEEEAKVRSRRWVIDGRFRLQSHYVGQNLDAIWQTDVGTGGESAGVRR